MTVEYLYLRLLLLSSVSYSFQCTGLSPLVKFFPMYFILLNVIVNGTIFLISLSDPVTSVWDHN